MPAVLPAIRLRPDRSFNPAPFDVPARHYPVPLLPKRGVSGFGDFIYDIPILGDVLGGALGREGGSGFLHDLGRIGGMFGLGLLFREIYGDNTSRLNPYIYSTLPYNPPPSNSQPAQTATGGMAMSGAGLMPWVLGGVALIVLAVVLTRK